jgi:CRP-like cAMP-binding protein
MRNPPSTTNRILDGLPASERARLDRRLEPVSLTLGQVIHEPGKAIRHVYFPVDCLVSLLTSVDRNRTLEVGMVGNEGMSGMPLILGANASAQRGLVQGSGEALRMAAPEFLVEFDRAPALQRALHRYTWAMMAQISQTAACNRFHEAPQRLARWLLMTRDRIGRDEFVLTHEFLAHMLGLRRSGVSVAAGALKRRRLIRYSRGTLQVLDAKGLMRASCSCYQVVNEVLERAR